MKKLILITLTAMTFSSCAFLPSRAERERKAAQEEFTENAKAGMIEKVSIEEYYLAAIGEANLPKFMKARDELSDAQGREVTSPREVVQYEALNNMWANVRIVVEGEKACAEKKHLCAFVSAYKDILENRSGCAAGKGMACMRMGRGYEGKDSQMATLYYKDACTAGEQAGCTLYQTAVQQDLADRAEAVASARAAQQNYLMQQAIESNNKPAPASVPFSPVRVRQPVNCYSQRIGNQVHTNCR